MDIVRPYDYLILKYIKCAWSPEAWSSKYDYFPTHIIYSSFFLSEFNPIPPNNLLNDSIYFECIYRNLKYYMGQYNTRQMNKLCEHLIHWTRAVFFKPHEWCIFDLLTELTCQQSAFDENSAKWLYFNQDQHHALLLKFWIFVLYFIPFIFYFVFIFYNFFRHVEYFSYHDISAMLRSLYCKIDLNQQRISPKWQFSVYVLLSVYIVVILCSIILRRPLSSHFILLLVVCLSGRYTIILKMIVPSTDSDD